MTVMNSLKVEDMLSWVKNRWSGIQKEREQWKFSYWWGRNQNSPLLTQLCHWVQRNGRIHMHSTEGCWSQCSSSAPGMDAAQASLTCLSFSWGNRTASTRVNWHVQCRETCYKYSTQPYGDPCSEI